MDIRIRYFGKLTDITRCNEELFDTQINAKLRTVIDDLFSKHPELKVATYTIFVNNKKSDLNNTTLNQDDEIVLMPPFSGG